MARVLLAAKEAASGFAGFSEGAAAVVQELEEVVLRPIEPVQEVHGRALVG